jgi:hypothetical protein
MLDRLEKAAWFSRAGKQDRSDGVAVTSWPEAIEYCRSFEWEDFQLEALNQFREYIAERSMERLNLWNATLREVRKITGPLTSAKIAIVVRENGLPKWFEGQVSHDISLFCMETEYADMCPPSLYTRMGYWYIDGHFPCGWSGVFPEGNLVVY